MSTQQPDEPAGATRRRLIMVHGGGFKPAAEPLLGLWREALGVGLERDFADAGGQGLLNTLDLQLAYYGDLANDVLHEAGRSLDPALDLEDRRQDLKRLASLPGKKPFRRARYEAVPGKSALREFAADVGAPLLGALGLAGPVLERTAPVLAAYLANRDGFRDACEARVRAVLAPALARRDHVLLLTHGLGSVVAYDTLWALCHDTQSAGASRGRVHTWITLGSPLASDYVRRRLRGATEPAERRYPDNLINWFNVAAEDDYYCYDKTVANDFAELIRRRQISRLRDYRLYNLAMRYGRSNPHNAVGYLVHSRLARMVADWVTGGVP